MPDISVSVDADGNVSYDPPFVILTAADQTITWNLSGDGWSWSSDPKKPGVEMVTNAGFPFSAWPEAATPVLTNGSYVAVLNQPNPPRWTYYKFFTNLVHTSGKTVRTDPDIGNQPQGG